MTEYDEAIEEIEFLARSHSRITVFDVLRTEGPLTRSELRDRLDVSRTTVTRNLDELEDRNWVTQANGEYAMTRVGELVADDLFDLVEVVGTAARLEGIMKWVPDEEFDLDLRCLTDADITLADPSDPYAPAREHAKRLELADEFRGLLPAVGHEPMRSARQGVLNGAEHELIVERSVADVIQTKEEYTDLIEEMQTAGRIEVRVVDDSIPYYVGLLDETVQIGVEDDDGLPRALLETDADEAPEWAERTYERYLRISEPIS